LRFLLRHPAADRLLVVATYRDDEPHPDVAESLAALAPRREVTTMELVGFDDHEARALIRTTCPTELAPTMLGVAFTLRDTTGGNPFHLRELLRELTGRAPLAYEREELEQTIAALAPDGIRALIDARIDHLSPVARDVVRIAAVLGADLSDATLAAVRTDQIHVTREAINELLDVRLLRERDWEIGRYEFPHALVRNAVYAGIADDEQARLHLRVAEALEAATSLGDRDAAALASHYTAVGTHDATAKAAEYARLAGDDAMTRLAFAEATKW
jgi:predicted ATPase